MNYIIGVFFYDNYNIIMETAAEVGVAGPGKMWLFCGALVSYLYDTAQTFTKNSYLANATYGNAVITDGGGAVGIPIYETFVKEWEGLGDNPDSLNYLNSKQPLSPDGKYRFNRTKDFFHLPPNHISIYSYEAIIGMGLSACAAATKYNTKYDRETIFSGKDHHEEFLKINFTSASGTVSIGECVTLLLLLFAYFRK